MSCLPHESTTLCARHGDNYSQRPHLTSHNMFHHQHQHHRHQDHHQQIIINTIMNFFVIVTIVISIIIIPPTIDSIAIVITTGLWILALALTQGRTLDERISGVATKGMTRAGICPQSIPHHSDHSGTCPTKRPHSSTNCMSWS